MVFAPIFVVLTVLFVNVNVPIPTPNGPFRVMFLSTMFNVVTLLYNGSVTATIPSLNIWSVDWLMSTLFAFNAAPPLTFITPKTAILSSVDTLALFITDILSNVYTPIYSSPTAATVVKSPSAESIVIVVAVLSTIVNIVESASFLSGSSSSPISPSAPVAESGTGKRALASAKTVEVRAVIAPTPIDLNGVLYAVVTILLLSTIRSPVDCVVDSRYIVPAPPSPLLPSPP